MRNNFTKTFYRLLPEEVMPNNKRGVAVDIYLQRSKDFMSEKTRLFKIVRQEMKNTYDQKVVAFNDTLTNNSSVLELTIIFPEGQLDREVNLTEPEHIDDYKNTLRDLGVESYDVYLPKYEVY
jgi:hypothetical protein